MDTLSQGPLTTIFGDFSESPMEALAFSTCSKGSLNAMDSCWEALFYKWIRRWGDANLQLVAQKVSPGKISKRLQDKDYYSPRKKFVRLVTTGASNSANVLNQIYHIACEKKFLSTHRFKNMLRNWTPIWVNFSYMLIEVLRSRTVTNRCAGAIVQELVNVWGANPHLAHTDGMRPLAICAARGFPEALKFFLEDQHCDSIIKIPGSFVVKAKIIKGKYSALEWANVMFDAESKAGTKISELKNLKQCIQLLSQSKVEITNEKKKKQRIRLSAKEETEE